MTYEKPMDILVIGGAGHVGSNLIEFLKECSFVSRLRSLDNYSNGSTQNHIEGVEYIEGEAKDLSNYFGPELDVIIHLGEFARIEQSFERYYFTFENNITGTLAVIDFCIKHNTKLVYSASSAITSMHEEEIVNAPYTIAKSANVNLINSISQYHNLNYAIVYFYNVYGPRERGFGDTATVVEKFLQLKFEGKTAIVNAPGTQKRNFTDVRDIVSGICKVLLHGHGDGFYIGNPTAYSIIELAEMIELEYTLGEPKLGNRTISQIDTSKLEKLGWSAKYDLKSYINGRLSKGA